MSLNITSYTPQSYRSHLHDTKKRISSNSLISAKTQQIATPTTKVSMQRPRTANTAIIQPRSTSFSYHPQHSTFEESYQPSSQPSSFQPSQSCSYWASLGKSSSFSTSSSPSSQFSSLDVYLFPTSSKQLIQSSSGSQSRSSSSRCSPSTKAMLRQEPSEEIKVSLNKKDPNIELHERNVLHQKRLHRLNLDRSVVIPDRSENSRLSFYLKDGHTLKDTWMSKLEMETSLRRASKQAIQNNKSSINSHYNNDNLSLVTPIYSLPIFMPLSVKQSYQITPQHQQIAQNISKHTDQKKNQQLPYQTPQQIAQLNVNNIQISEIMGSSQKSNRNSPSRSPIFTPLSARISPSKANKPHNYMNNTIINSSSLSNEIIHSFSLQFQDHSSSEKQPNRSKKTNSSEKPNKKTIFSFRRSKGEFYQPDRAMSFDNQCSSQHSLRSKYISLIPAENNQKEEAKKKQQNSQTVSFLLGRRGKTAVL